MASCTQGVHKSGKSICAAWECNRLAMLFKQKQLLSKGLQPVHAHYRREGFVQDTQDTAEAAKVCCTCLSGCSQYSNRCCSAKATGRKGSVSRL